MLRVAGVFSALCTVALAVLVIVRPANPANSVLISVMLLFIALNLAVVFVLRHVDNIRARSAGNTTE